MPKFALRAACLLASISLWAGSLQLFYRPAESSVRPPTGMSPTARALLSRQLTLWSDSAVRARETSQMRASNPEWDFMGRTYLVLALANAAMRDPSLKDQCVTVIDRILEDTLSRERNHGMYYFLMPYAHAAPWVFQPERSVFVDGEIAVMLGARRVLREDTLYRELLRVRAERISEQMLHGPIGSAESYPNECWTFCNTLSLVALRIHDSLDGTHHQTLTQRWLSNARARLIDRRSGLLVSSYTLDGQVRDGPEGSSIYMVAHDLVLLDPTFAREQYALAHRWLNREILGFGYAREWPDTRTQRQDIDSGPTIPFVEANAGASGMALLGAGAFHDTRTLSGLLASLDLAAFPIHDGNELRYAASNPVGDAVLLYSLVEGPLWQEVSRRSPP